MTISYLSVCMDNDERQFEQLAESIKQVRPQVVMLQDVPYLSEEDLHLKLLQPFNGQYKLLRKNADELNIDTGYINDNLILVNVAYEARLIVDPAAKEWMSKSDISMLLVDLTNAEFIYCVLNIFINPQVTEDDMLRNAYWIKKTLDKEGLDPDDMMITGSYSEAFDNLLRRVLDVSRLGHVDAVRRSGRGQKKRR